MRPKFPTSSGNGSRVCPKCGRKVARSYEGAQCPVCDSAALYREVKEYVRSHDVTEMELADIFDIPLSQVREWINEGFLTYGDDNMTPI